MSSLEIAVRERWRVSGFLIQCLGTSFLRDGMVDKSLNGRLIRALWIPLCLGGIVACGGDSGGAAGLGDATVLDSGYVGESCEPLGVRYGTAEGQSSCVTVQELPGGGGAELRVRANCTDEAITALLDKPHLVMVPDDVSRDDLWLHFGGSGGTPTNTKGLGVAAASEGYRYISLAYPNEPSINERCLCPTGARPANCEELIRYELLYGNDVTPWFDMDGDEAIVPRLVALLSYLHNQRPADGWDGFLTDAGEIRWSRIAISGFSQGGGMAGMLARDHELARVLYLSKGAGSVASLALEPANVVSCAQSVTCELGECCAPTDWSCREGVPAEGGVCIWQVPAPWASYGRDTDGDGVGDGTASDRATPAERQFALVHREEGAWNYSPEVFALWGLGGGRETYFDADGSRAPTPGTQLFSTVAPPRNRSCSAHQSIGGDSCQPRDAAGVPLMAPMWRFVMSVALPVE